MNTLRLFGRAFQEAGDDGITTHAAALAFYAALSLAPLLILLLYISGTMGPDTQEQLVRQVVRLMGRGTGQIVRQIVTNVQAEESAGTLSLSLGALTLVFSATALFSQLHEAMNRIWGIRSRKGHGLFVWFRRRTVALGMVAIAGLVMLISMTASTAVRFMFPDQRVIWFWVNMGISICVQTVVFAMMFKLLPDVKLYWRDVFPAAVLTAALFVFGKFAIGSYLSRSGVGSAYGAAGSLIVFLAWVYYTSLIVFYGAELAQVTTVHRGRDVVPLKHATFA